MPASRSTEFKCLSAADMPRVMYCPEWKPLRGLSLIFDERERERAERMLRPLSHSDFDWDGVSF